MPKTPWPRGPRKTATNPDAFAKLRAQIFDAQLQLSELHEATAYLAANVRKHTNKLNRLIHKYKVLTAYGPQREGNSP